MQHADVSLYLFSLSATESTFRFCLVEATDTAGSSGRGTDTFSRVQQFAAEPSHCALLLPTRPVCGRSQLVQ